MKKAGGREAGDRSGERGTTEVAALAISVKVPLIEPAA
jgi:hypothetical protein